MFLSKSRYLNKFFRMFSVIGALLGSSSAVLAAVASFEENLVYGYKDGMALVMTVLHPSEAANGAGVIRVLSGGMVSKRESALRTARRPEVQALLKAGFTVFAVTHSCSPRFTVNEISADLPQAIEYIETFGEKFGVEPGRLGLLGYSSGGQLSLLAASGYEGESAPLEGRKARRDGTSVGAVVAFFAGTDNLNIGDDGMTIADYFRSKGADGVAAFDFKDWNPESHRYERVTDSSRLEEVFRNISPIYHLSSHFPPVLLFHGGEDRFIPVSQSQRFYEKAREFDVPAKLVIEEGQGHGWKQPQPGELAALTEWFQRWLVDEAKADIEE